MANPVRRILLTRPRSSSERWAALLAAHGFVSVIEPLLTIVPTQEPQPVGQFQAIIITSAGALEALAQRQTEIADLLSLPCYCVGAATGEAARRIGFRTISCGESDGAELAGKIIEALADKTRPLLHMTGDVVDGKIKDILVRTGFFVTPWQVYGTRPAEDFTFATRALFASGSFYAVPVFSPRTARILVSIIEKNALVYACHGIIAIGLSQAVADVLQTLPWKHVRVASLPNEESVLACLKSEAPMPIESDIPPAPLPPPRAAQQESKGSFFLALLLIIALAAAGAFVFTDSQWFNKQPPAKDDLHLVQDMQVLQERVRILESRLDAEEQKQDQNAASPAVPVSAAISPELADSVKNVQTQMTQIQNEQANEKQATRQWVAAAFAFWDLRNAADEGRAFGAQLAALQESSQGDASIAPQLATLFTYAGGVSTFAQLHDEVAAQEPAITGPAPAEPAQAQTIGDRLKNIMRTFVSVHPLHNAQLDALESALQSGNGVASLAAFDSLPDGAKKDLAAWHEKLQARIATDAALHDLGAHFAAAGNTL